MPAATVRRRPGSNILLNRPRRTPFGVGHPAAPQVRGASRPQVAQLPGVRRQVAARLCVEGETAPRHRVVEHDLAGGGWPAWRHQRVRVGLGPDGIGPATWLALRTITSIRPDLELTVAPLVFRTALPALDGGDVDALLLHGPVDEVGPRRVVTVGWVPVGVLMPRHHWLAHRADVDLDAVLPLLRALPPRQMGEAFTQFWFLPDRLRSPPPAVQMESERTPAMASEAARTGLVGLWPADIVVPPASGAVVRPLADPAWAPLQVVVREGWPLGDEVVAATRDAVRATAPLTGTALARPDQES